MDAGNIQMATIGMTIEQLTEGRSQPVQRPAPYVTNYRTGVCRIEAIGTSRGSAL